MTTASTSTTQSATMQTPAAAAAAARADIVGSDTVSNNIVDADIMNGGAVSGDIAAPDAADAEAADHESLDRESLDRESPDLDDAEVDAADLDDDAFELPDPAAVLDADEMATETAAPVTPRTPHQGTHQQGSGRSSAHAAAHAEARELFRRMAELAPQDPARAQIRDRLVRMHLPLVEHLARRFRNRGEPLDDLTQVATIGLIKSVDRFDPQRGVEFSTYATPTIIGEIKRHFRDKGWAVRVPRRLQELRLSLTAATSELSQRNGRSPTVAELAGHLGLSEEEVLEGLESANAYSTLSLDVPESGDDESPAVADSLGSEDEALEGVEYRESLKPLLEQLPAREKRILLLRFFGNMTQSQIADEIGISQMHVSRLLARTLAQLREKLLVDE